MIIKKVLYPDRLRKITGSFAFIEHRFLGAGFWNALSHHELLLYLLLVVVADRNGLSYYSYSRATLVFLGIIFALNLLIIIKSTLYRMTGL